MTPLITEMVRLADSPESLTWFDIGRAPEEGFDFEVDGDQLTHLPFPKMAVCGIDANGHKFMLMLIAGESSVSVAGFVLWNKLKYEAIDAFAYIDTPEGVRLLPGQGTLKKQDCMNAMSIIGMLLSSLNTGATAYRPAIKTNSHINKRRLAKGQSAIIFSWHTVVVDAKTAPQDGLGGTHASPRQHERRGHWRVTSSGKKVWVRNCMVGDPALGSVFHDYQVKQNFSMAGAQR